MRLTNLNFRNPTEMTPAYHESQNGRGVYKNTQGISSMKGSFSREPRMKQGKVSKEMLVGPSSYNADQSYKLLQPNRCSSVFSKLPSNQIHFENPNEFMIVGNTVKRIVSLREIPKQSKINV